MFYFTVSAWCSMIDVHDIDRRNVFEKFNLKKLQSHFQGVIMWHVGVCISFHEALVILYIVLWSWHNFMCLQPFLLNRKIGSSGVQLFNYQWNIKLFLRAELSGSMTNRMDGMDIQIFVNYLSLLRCLFILAMAAMTAPGKSLWHTNKPGPAIPLYVFYLA